MKKNERLIVSVECTSHDPTLRVYVTHATATSSTRREVLSTSDPKVAHAVRCETRQELQDNGVIDEDGWVLGGAK